MRSTTRFSSRRPPRPIHTAPLSASTSFSMPTPKAALPAAPPAAHRDLRLALAGALAGMVTNTLLHPLDTVKTLRQTDPTSHRGVLPALRTVIESRGPLALYAGIAPALVGSALSSALYFGVYELVKSRLQLAAPSAFRTRRLRAPLTAASAACGNIASSVLFVPKEVVKQRMQAGLHKGHFFTAAAAVVRTSGMQGLYRGYKATLLRNIPSTMIRFTLYEEFKLLAARARGVSELSPPEYVVAGALSGVVASTCTTPMDVIKTRLATGAIKPGTGIVPALFEILQRDGVAGLFVGLRPRLIWAALFAAVGFTSYEVCKAWTLGLRKGALGGRMALKKAEQDRIPAPVRSTSKIVMTRRRGLGRHAVCARRGWSGTSVRAGMT